MLIPLTDGGLLVPTLEIKREEPAGDVKGVKESSIHQMVWASLMVMAFNCQNSTQNQRTPSFLHTMTTGDAQWLLDSLILYLFSFLPLHSWILLMIREPDKGYCALIVCSKVEVCIIYFSMPTITLNILAYCNMSSSLTHLTTFSMIPFIVTYILLLFLFSFLFFFVLFLPYVHTAYLFIMPSGPPYMAPSPWHSGVQRISRHILDSTVQVRVGTHGSSNGPTHDLTPQDRLSAYSIHYTNIRGLNFNFSSAETHLATFLPNRFLPSETQLSNVKTVFH